MELIALCILGDLALWLESLGLVLAAKFAYDRGQFSRSRRAVLRGVSKANVRISRFDVQKTEHSGLKTNDGTGKPDY